MIATAFANLFVYCYFGMLATKSYMDMSDSMYESNWYKLPIQLQTYIILMIENMQRPLYYHGFGMVILDLETFTKVSYIYLIVILRN